MGQFFRLRGITKMIELDLHSRLKYIYIWPGEGHIMARMARNGPFQEYD